MLARHGAVFAFACCVFAASVCASYASSPCSESSDPEDATLAVLHCGTVIVVAEATAVHSPAMSMSAHQGAIQLDAGAIAVSANSPGAQFSALTPDAVVSGADGEWLVLAQPGGTRAVVWRGTVVARQRADGSQKVLQPGDGAANDVDAQRSDRLAAALRRAQAAH